jgi:glycosyltransferase involved in cell wall biosynthesis
MNTDSTNIGLERVAYVVKRYPRFSETFIVNEILAHEAAGLDISIFALRPPSDTHFQQAISRVRAPVTYLRAAGIKAEMLWTAMDQFGRAEAGSWELLGGHLGDAVDCSGTEVYQALQLVREIRAQRIEHLHAHFATTAATVARLAARMAGIPYSLTAHAKDIYHEQVDRDELGRKLADASAVVTVSDYNLDHLGRTYPASAAHLHRIYNGLDLDSFPYTPPKTGSPRIVAVGRLVEKKGFSDLLEACALLAQSQVDYQCELIGTGELEESLRGQIRQLHLEQRVRMTGPRPLPEVARALGEATMMVAPCITASTGDRDGLPTVLLEAMALGTPCISTRVAGIPELVRHEETGLLVSERQPAQLADAIGRMLTDAQLRVNLSVAARQLIEEQFDIRQAADRIRTLFAAAGRPPVSQNSRGSIDRADRTARPTLAEVG